MTYAFRLTVFIVIGVLALIFFLLWFFYKPAKAFIFRHNVSRVFYNRVMKTVKYGDYYLVNNLKMDLSGTKYIQIDHIIGGDKFIYVVTDRYFDGALQARREDEVWTYYKQGGKKSHIPNPLFENRAALERLALSSGINSSFMVGIVLLNDDCFLTPIDNVEGEPLLTPLSQLSKVIASYEKKDVKPFVKDELWQAIHDLHDLRDENANGSKEKR